LIAAPGPAVELGDHLREDLAARLAELYPDVSRMVLAGDLNPGDRVTLDEEDGRLRLDVTEAAGAAEERAKAEEHASAQPR